MATTSSLLRESRARDALSKVRGHWAVTRTVPNCWPVSKTSEMKLGRIHQDEPVDDVSSAGVDVDKSPFEERRVPGKLLAGDDSAPRQDRLAKEAERTWHAKQAQRENFAHLLCRNSRATVACGLEAPADVGPCKPRVDLPTPQCCRVPPLATHLALNTHYSYHTEWTAGR